MTVQDIQKFLETHVPSACVPVDLLKIAKSIGCQRVKIPAPRTRLGHTGALTLVLDGDSCLDRLYGGYFSDWVCGGQWNRMLQFLSVLVRTVQDNNIELAVFFNGALEEERLSGWSKSQLDIKKNVNYVLKHVAIKGTPPPKIWWVPPVGLKTCLRLALRYLNIPVYCTLDDHHQEVISFCRENNYHGLMAEDAEYFVFDPPRYFSSRQLKLTYKGSLETKEFILDEVGRGVGLSRSSFCYLAALMGNHLLTEDDLRDFYSSIIPNYSKEETTAEEKIRALSKYILNYCEVPVSNLLYIGTQIFGSINDSRTMKFKEAVHYFINGCKDGYYPYKSYTPNPNDPYFRYGYAHPPPPQINGGRHAEDFHVDSRNGFHSDSKDRDEPRYPEVPHEILRTASERHQKGMMSPWIYQILSQGEIKIGPCMEEQYEREFPNIVQFYRPIRQNIYAILFNHHHSLFLARKARGEGQNDCDVPAINIKEWVYTKDNPYRKPDIVPAMPLSWAVPTVQRMWFGSVIEDKKRRLRAFLSCMRSDTVLMLDTYYVPQHILIVSTVLRYIISKSGGSLLRRQEIDAFLVTAFSSDLNNAYYLQDLQLPVVTPRGVQLASFFMTGVEMALLVNDVCGDPVPWLMCCPWNFFDGKLFHCKLHKANNSRSLFELCDGDMDLVSQVERCRESILEGLRIDMMGSQPQPAYMGPRMGGFHPSHMYNNHSHDPHHYMPRYGGRGRGRGGTSGRHLCAGGGQLQVAGVVVGSWGPNYGTNTNRRHYNGMAPRGRPDPRHLMRGSHRGRPSVLAKRRMFTPKTHYSRGGRRGESTPKKQSSKKEKKDEETEDSGAVTCNGEENELGGKTDHFNEGLKSPDSGVNVSILE